MGRTLIDDQSSKFQNGVIVIRGEGLVTEEWSWKKTFVCMFVAAKSLWGRGEDVGDAVEGWGDILGVNGE